MDFLFTGPYIPFTAALMIMFGLGIIEAIGLGASGLLDIDSPLEGKSFDGLSWLGVGKVPLLMLFTVFLAIFGLVGIFGQQIFSGMGGELPLFIAVPMAFVASLAPLGTVAGLLARIIPSEESTAVSMDSFIRKRVNVISDASHTQLGVALYRDPYGAEHTLNIRTESGIARKGDVLLVTRREGSSFYGVMVTSSELRPV
jgi:hypothetical protein